MSSKYPLTYLVVSVAFMLSRIRLVEFLLELSDQIILRVHDIQVFVFVPIPFVLLVLTGAADVIEDLPQFVTLGWSRDIDINMDTQMETENLEDVLGFDVSHRDNSMVTKNRGCSGYGLSHGIHQVLLQRTPNTLHACASVSSFCYMAKKSFDKHFVVQ